MGMVLSVIIVNYNGRKQLKACFDSLYAQLSDIDFEIIVVDNNSSDDSCGFITESYPDVRLIQSPENLGFGRGNNIGVANAVSDLVLLLNNDTILLDSPLPAIRNLLANPDYGVITINMLDANSNYIPAIGRFPTPLRLVKLSLLNDTREAFISGKFDTGTDYKADWVTGSFMLMRRRDFESVGGFDSDYFMYVEDVDLCKKLADIGKSSIFMPAMRYIHFVGFRPANENMLTEGYRIYVHKHFTQMQALTARLMLSLNMFIKKLKAITGMDKPRRPR